MKAGCTNHNENDVESTEFQEAVHAVPPWGETVVVGKPQPRVDAYDRVSGSAVYALDLSLPDMLYGAIVRCPHPHAMVKSVDTSQAEKMPGVRAVLTDADQEAKVPWYSNEGKPTSRLLDPHCRYAGDEVAAVAAETPHQAWEAACAVVVEYQPLPFVLDADESWRPGAPVLHEGGNLVHPPLLRQRGDVAKGFAEADVVLEETYRTSCELHSTMEIHGSVAKWDGDRLTVWDTTQGVFNIQRQLADVLKLPLSSVRVISHYMGGGFGSKFDLNKHTVIAALLARKIARPVRLFLTREESFLCVGNRPPCMMTLRAGVKNDGSITALQFTNIGAAGAYPMWAVAGYQVSELYLCPNVRREERSVCTNAGQGRAMRAPGYPPCSWALEQMMDALAEKVGMDPVEFRVKSVPTISQVMGNNPYTSTGLKQCLKDGAEAFGWKEAWSRPKAAGPVVRGVGVAAGLWDSAGGPPATAILKLFSDGSVNLNTGAADIGTGTKTALAMVIAEELGVSVDRIQIEHADTGTTPYAEVSWGSITIMNNAPAVREAALNVKQQLLELGAEEFKIPVANVVFQDGKVAPSTDLQKGKPLSQLKGLTERQVLIGIGYRGPNPTGKEIVSFAAHFAEVEVNTRTGEVRVVRLVAAHDSGQVMNLLAYRNQVFGGVTMGIGFGLTEQRVLDRQTGKMVNANWHDYKIPTAKDVPIEPVCVPIDPHDTECNSVGAKGLGEPATIPTAAAIANAVYHATGIRVTQAPITPMQMLKLLAQQRGGN